MVSKKIAVLPGDGIGPEVCRQAVKVLEAVADRFGHHFDLQPYLMGACAIDATGNPLPDETLEACRAADAVLLGAIGDPKYDHDPSAKVRPEQGLLRLRKSLGLFANIRPVTAYRVLLEHSPLKRERIEGTDLLIFRELTGGIYFGDKGRTADGEAAYDHCTYSRPEIERIAHLAFRAAAGRRRKLTLVDKANVLETSRLWREVVREMAAQYPEVAVDYLFVDNAAMQIILNPTAVRCDSDREHVRRHHFGRGFGHCRLAGPAALGLGGRAGGAVRAHSRLLPAGQRQGHCQSHCRHSLGRHAAGAPGVGCRSGAGA